VSACLIALVNRTGKHVQLSLLSGATAMLESAQSLRAGDNDLGFPHQEAPSSGRLHRRGLCLPRQCRRKGAQVKRFCALEPESCTGLARIH